MPKNREHTESYLLEQMSAMRWLKEQGLSCKDIKDLSWGRVDETDRSIHFPTPVTSYKMDLRTGKIEGATEIKDVSIPIKGSGHEWFFLRSKYKSPWVFTKKIPKTWRKEGSREDCYSLKDVENITKLTSSPVIPPLLEEIELLTKTLVSDRMKVSIANITKAETKEQTKEKTRV